jgi:uncharacterized membrane protein/predicted DsbA family dithiol-disulfide isomerase
MGRTRFRASALLAAVGFCISAALTYLHLRAVADPEGYKSFCNISPGVNCDAVALSKYAVVLGVPNSVYGALFYVLLGLLAVTAARSSRAQELRLAGHLFILASGALLYSFYLGGISYFRLRTVCVLCSALYVVNLALFLAIGSLAQGSPLRLVRNLISDVVALVRRRPVVLTSAVCASLAILLVFAVLDVRARELAAERFLTVYADLDRVPLPRMGSVSFGPEDAPVVIYEVFDYGCSACREAHGGLKKLLRDYPSQVRLVLTDLPQCYDCQEGDDPRELPVPCILPLVARYAHTEHRWWETSRALFEHAAGLESWDDVAKLAGDVGLDTTRLTDALVHGELLHDLQRDIGQVRWLGLDAVPTFVVNGRIVPVVPSRRMFDAIIRYELEHSADGAGE